MTNAYLIIVNQKNSARIPVSWENDEITQGNALFNILTNDSQFNWLDDNTIMEVFLANDTSVRCDAYINHHNKKVMLDID